jgi:uncharacterized membrane protein
MSTVSVPTPSDESTACKLVSVCSRYATHAILMGAAEWRILSHAVTHKLIYVNKVQPYISKIYG